MLRVLSLEKGLSFKAVGQHSKEEKSWCVYFSLKVDTVATVALGGVRGFLRVFAGRVITFLKGLSGLPVATRLNPD